MVSPNRRFIQKGDVQNDTLLTLGGLLALPVLLAGSTAAQVSINAAGASFPNAIYQQWGQEFKGAKINYQSVGSGAGINQLTQGTIDYGASDMPMKDEQIAKMKVKPLHFPTVLGAVVPVYNIPGVTGELKFTGETLAGIYLGEIKKCGMIRRSPPTTKGVKLPDAEITKCTSRAGWKRYDLRLVRLSGQGESHLEG